MMFGIYSEIQVGMYNVHNTINSWDAYVDIGLLMYIISHSTCYTVGTYIDWNYRCCSHLYQRKSVVSSSLN